VLGGGLARGALTSTPPLAACSAVCVLRVSGEGLSLSGEGGEGGEVSGRREGEGKGGSRIECTGCHGKSSTAGLVVEA
jgi:hypothetical protein